MNHSFPNSIREINDLAEAEKNRIYQSLIPPWIFEEFPISRESQGKEGQVYFVCPTGSRSMELTIRLKPTDNDPLFYINTADTFNNQLLVLLVVVNDPYAPRFEVDVDENGNKTNFGTTSRNIPAEEAALAAGLAPGQIRKGLRSFRRSLPIFEDFIRNMGHEMFMIEPLAYHNAIIFERYGFNYMRGLKDMQAIHQAFQEGGDYQRKLTAENPFRQPEFWQTVRGRSWAIHDGILGEPFTGFQMYKHVGKESGVTSFPDAIW